MGMPWFPCTLGESKTRRRLGKRTAIRKRCERPNSHWLSVVEMVSLITGDGTSWNLKKTCF